MKKLIFTLLLIPNTVFAFGSLQVRQPIYSYLDNYSTELGLYVREDINDKYAYQSWTGLRFDQYAMTNQDILYKYSDDFSFGVGAGYRMFNDSKNEYLGTVVIDLKLWK